MDEVSPTRGESGAAARLATSMRPNGLLVMALVVAGGLSASAGLYRWLQPKAAAAFRAEVAAVPDDPASRLRAWREYGAPTIHQRLVTARISFQQPWLVTHAVDSATEGEAPAVWGVDLDRVGPEATTVAGLDVVVRLPAPELLHRTVLVGNNARGVRHYRPDETPPDAREALRAKVQWLLQKLTAALERDVEGARLVVVIGDEPVPARP